MKKILLTTIALLFPVVAFANIPASWYATSPSATSVTPNLINGVNQNLKVPALSSTGNPCVVVGTTGLLATSTCGTVSNVRYYNNVKDFGAIGDNTHDDTAAIQAAINQSTTTSYRVVYFPPGQYKITKELIVRNGTEPSTAFGQASSGYSPARSVIFQGDGPGKSVIHQVTNAANGIRFATTTNFGGANQDWGQVKDLEIDGPGGSTSSGAGIYIEGNSGGMNMFTVQDVWISRFNVGIRANTDDSTYKNVWLQDNMIGFWGEGYSEGNSNIIESPIIQTFAGDFTAQASTTGIRLDNGGGWKIFGSDMGGDNMATGTLVHGAITLTILQAHYEIDNPYYTILDTSGIQQQPITLDGMECVGQAPAQALIYTNGGTDLHIRGDMCSHNAQIGGQPFIYVNDPYGGNVTFLTYEGYNTDQYAWVRRHYGSTDYDYNISGPWQTGGIGATVPSAARYVGATLMTYGTNANTRLEMGVKHSDNTYGTANLIQYYTDRRANIVGMTNTSNTWSGVQTMTNASTTNLSVGTDTYLTGLTSTVLAVDANHKVVATTTTGGSLSGGTALRLPYWSSATSIGTTSIQYATSTGRLGLNRTVSNATIGGVGFDIATNNNILANCFSTDGSSCLQNTWSLSGSDVYNYNKVGIGQMPDASNQLAVAGNIVIAAGTGGQAGDIQTSGSAYLGSGIMSNFPQHTQGNVGDVLSSTGSGLVWTATSSLGISGGSSAPLSTNPFIATKFVGTSTTDTSDFYGGVQTGSTTLSSTASMTSNDSGLLSNSATYPSGIFFADPVNGIASFGDIANHVNGTYFNVDDNLRSIIAVANYGFNFYSTYGYDFNGGNTYVSNLQVLNGNVWGSGGLSLQYDPNSSNGIYIGNGNITLGQTAEVTSGTVQIDAASSYVDDIACFTSGGKIGHMTQATLLAGGGSASCSDF